MLRAFRNVVGGIAFAILSRSLLISSIGLFFLKKSSSSLVGKILQVARDTDNHHDQFAVGVLKEDAAMCLESTVTCFITF